MVVTASTRAKPSASASNILQEPVGERRLSAVSSAVTAGEVIGLVPATTALVASPCCSTRKASCKAMSEA